MFWKVLILLMSTKFSLSLAPNDVLILILSQPDEYHSQLAYNLRLDIFNQSILISKDNLVNVHLTHEIFNHIGDWTILYILPNLMRTNLINDNIKWIVFCEDQSKIILVNLLKELNKVDHKKEIYLGHPMYDQEATIIHHFAFFEYPKWFPYPLIRSGIAFSKPLINTLEKQLTDRKKLPRTEFFIDASHELSFFIWQNIKIENNKWKITFQTIEKNQHKNSIKLVNATISKDDHHHNNNNNNSTSDNKEIYIQSQFEYDMNSTISNRKQYLTVDRNSKRKILANKMENNSNEYNKQTNIQKYDNNNNNNNSKNMNKKIYNSIKHDNIDDTDTTRTKISSNKRSTKDKRNSYNTKEKIRTTKSPDNKMITKLLLYNASAYFCIEKGNNCAIYPKRKQENDTLCQIINPKNIYFAIKTCQKFHKERIPMIEATWGQYTPIKRYFSDVKDIYIPTIATGVPNTDSGHCAKALQILRIVINDIDTINKEHFFDIKWIVLSDDDTLLSISSICDILGCLNPSSYIYLGERYGYRLHAKDGFNYITGGGSIVFSLPTARKIIKFCTCPQETSPDDMIIGACLRNLGIYPIHSSRFHQGRPNDYPMESLKIEKAISFHKFWQIDPVHIYQTFLNGFLDEKLPNLHKYQFKKHEPFSSFENNISNCDDILECTQVAVKFNKDHLSKIENENIEHRRKLQAFSRSSTLLPKSKLFQHVDL